MLETTLRLLGIKKQTMTFFVRFWPHILAAILLTGLLTVVNGWRKDAAKLEETQQAFQRYKDQVATSEKTKKEVSDAFKDERKDLADNRKPAPVVRMCKQPVLPDNRPPAGSDGSAAATGSIPETTGLRPESEGPNVGRPLYGAGDRADLLSAQLRACQDYILKLKKQSK